MLADLGAGISTPPGSAPAPLSRSRPSDPGRPRLRAFTERQGEDLYELISERVRRGSMIVTSNRPPAEWYALFPNPVLAEGALDRLINAAHHVTLEGGSYRPRQRPAASARSAQA